MDQSAYIKKLERKIANQRVQLRWWNDLIDMYDSNWRRMALGYRKQVEDAGIKPNYVWRPLYEQRNRRIKRET